VIAAFAVSLDASNACQESPGAEWLEPFYCAWGCFRVFVLAAPLLPANEAGAI
jgi:hypothetical protein